MGFTEEGALHGRLQPDTRRHAFRGIGGVLATVHEITEKVIGERRVVILRDLGAQVGRGQRPRKRARWRPRRLPATARTCPLRCCISSMPTAGMRGSPARRGSTGRQARARSSSRSTGAEPGLAGRWPPPSWSGDGTVTDLGARFDACRPAPGPTRRTAPWSCRFAPTRRTSWPGCWSSGVSARPTLDELYREFLRAGRQPDRHRHRQRARLRGGAQARRSAGRDRSRQDRVLLQRQPRVPHAADADARAGRGHAGREPMRLYAGEPSATRDRAPQQPAPAEARQHAARFLAHRGRRARAKYRADRPCHLHGRAGQHLPVRRASAQACAAGGLPAAAASRSMSIATCGKRSSSIARPTPSSSRLQGEIAVRSGAVDGRSSSPCATRASAFRPRASAHVRALPPRRRARGRTHEGTGIGLALVQELVKLHGGEVEGCKLTATRAACFTRQHPAWATSHLDPNHDRRGDRPSGFYRDRCGQRIIEEALRWLPDAEPEPKDGFEPLADLTLPKLAAASGARASSGPTTMPTCAVTSPGCSATRLRRRGVLPTARLRWKRHAPTRRISCLPT